MAGRREYRREFFDREYAAGEAYARLWRLVKPYRARVLLGLFCGLISAGALMPFYQMVRPVAAEVPMTRAAAEAPRGAGRMEREMAKASKMPAWFSAVESAAARAGFDLKREDGSMSGMLLLAVFLVLPAVCALRLLMVFLSQYCLAWSVTKAIADLRIQLLAHVQRQSMQFHGRVDVGQLLTRMTGDPNQLARILPVILAELAAAPFEIAVSLAFIVSYAAQNHLGRLLLVLVAAVPLFVLPVAALGRRMRK